MSALLGILAAALLFAIFGFVRYRPGCGACTMRGGARREADSAHGCAECDAVEAPEPPRGTA